jgi:hypothetical protein
MESVSFLLHLEYAVVPQELSVELMNEVSMKSDGRGRHRERSFLGDCF